MTGPLQLAHDPLPQFAEDPYASEFPVHRVVVAHVADGLDGALRVASMLRGRRYRVRNFSLQMREGVVVSAVRATVVLTSDDTDHLLERLRRIPAVESTERG